ncbi:hypothetical protein D9M72_520170 [compost metagenome]
MLADVVQGVRQSPGPDVVRTCVQPQEIVCQEDGLHVGDFHPAHHHFQVHTGTVLAHFAGGAEHLDVQRRVLLLQAHQGRGNEFRTESIGRADPDHAGQ